MGFFWENSQKTCDLFSQKTAGKHVTILPSKTMANCLCVFQENRQRKRQSVSLGNSWDKDKFFLFVSLENNQGNRLPFWDSNRWNNFILFSLCLRGKRFKRFPGKHKLYMFSKAVFLENGDHPQQCHMPRYRFVFFSFSFDDAACNPHAASLVSLFPSHSMTRHTTHMPRHRFSFSFDGVACNLHATSLVSFSPPHSMTQHTTHMPRHWFLFFPFCLMMWCVYMINIKYTIYNFYHNQKYTKAILRIPGGNQTKLMCA